MTERDARDLVDWLDQAEEETKATIAEHERSSLHSRKNA